MFYKLLKFPLHKQQYLLLSGLKIWIYPSSNRTVPTVYLQLQGLQNTVCTIVHIIIHMAQYCTFVKAHYICTFLGLKRQPLDRVHFFGMLGVFHCTFTVQYSTVLHLFAAVVQNLFPVCLFYCGKQCQFPGKYIPENNNLLSKTMQ